MSPSPFHGIFNFGMNAAQKQGSGQLPTVELETDREVEDTTPPAQQGAQGPQVGQIAVDIYERDDYYIIRAPIAGIRLSDLDIEIDGKEITIRGMRKLTEEIAEDQYYLQECFWGEFSRTVTLPCMIDPKKVKATFSKDSILKVLVPKEDKVKIVRVSEA